MVIRLRAWIVAAVAVMTLGWPVAVRGAEEAPAAVPSRRDVMVPMRDGVRLATDVYLPRTSRSQPAFPTLLVRTPYGKTTQGTVGLAAEGVKRGYAVVLQDCRGRFASEGRNLPFIGESLDASDGHDTLKWISQQVWCNGRVGATGGSATGITQLFMAPGAGPRLAAQHIGVAPPSLFHGMVYPGGIFRKHLIESWITATRFEPGAMETWLAHPSYDGYWRRYDVSGEYERVDVPAVHVGGYFDIFAPGTVASFEGYRRGGAKARDGQRLLLGPWTHATMIEYSGVLRFPGADKPPGIVGDPWRWFDHHLKGRPGGSLRGPAVTYYVMGDVDDPAAPGKLWKTADQWPPASVRPVNGYFHHDGSLVMDSPGSGPPRSYTSDPGDPCPTVGGMQFFKGITVGTQDQRPIEGRGDVLVYSTEPLTRPLEVTGSPVVKLWVSTDAPDTDFFVKLCDVYPDGRSFNVSEGQLRARFRESFSEPRLLEPGAVYPIAIELSPTSIAFNKGHRLRVLIASSSSPGFAVNPQNGDPFVSDNPARRARNTVYGDPERPSHLVLPVDGRTP